MIWSWWWQCDDDKTHVAQGGAFLCQSRLLNLAKDEESNPDSEGPRWWHDEVDMMMIYDDIMVLWMMIICDYDMMMFDWNRS